MNRSVIRTKKAIRKAFLELLEEKKDMDKITVIELTNRVGIVRSTFYSHYKDIEDVGKEIQTEMLTFIDQITKEYLTTDNPDTKAFISEFFKFFDERKQEYYEFFKSDFGSNSFMGEFKLAFADYFMKNVKFCNSEFFGNNKEFEARFFASILTGLISINTQGLFGFTVDDVIEFTNRLYGRLH